MNADLEQDFEQRVDLAAARLGGVVLLASDDFFAEKENLLRDEAPIWIAERYTDHGKWMDGWESRRRRTPGHDWCVLRLGMPGVIRGVVVDT
ncbi:MAG: bifunctional allantoicase/OHCU decarboxylase, partial [Candidatus Eisenbacteria bacterium]